MLVSSVMVLGLDLTGEQRLELVAVVLGVLVFVVIVLVVERRNSGGEVMPPGRTALDPQRPTVRRAPATAVPIASARVAADTPAAAYYAVPFLADAPPDDGHPPPGSA
ncbi:MAG TPA: hypothetical protein VIN56_06805 [Candidatus Dormibacteraeota bacterium]|jgi:hypothetical protein